MTLPAFSPAAMASSASSPSASAAYGAAASDASAPDAVGAATERAEGGFAAALDEATASFDADSANGSDGAAGAATSTPCTAMATPAAPAVGGAHAASDGAATAAMAPASGWPPPGLSSLFPGAVPTSPALDPARTPAPAAPPSATNAGPAAMAASRVLPAIAATGAAVPALAGATLPAAILPAADTVPPSPASPRDALLAVPAIPLPAAAPSPAGATPGTDALAAALARQPAVLRLPNLDDGDAAALTAIAETLAPERPPDGALPLSTAAPTMPKLDLLHAFPAPVPLPSPRFAEDVGARLQWIAEQQGGEATLRISPDGLGPVEIRLKLDGDRVELGFSATQTETRQALQDALPKLREMLAQQGLQLGHADVGQKHAQTANEQARRDAKGATGDDGGEAITAAPAIREATLVIGRGGRGVLDLYA